MKEERRKDMSKGKWCLDKLGFKGLKIRRERERVIMKEREWAP